MGLLPWNGGAEAPVDLAGADGQNLTGVTGHFITGISPIQVRLQMTRGDVAKWLAYASAAVIMLLLWFMVIDFAPSFAANRLAFASVFAIPLVISLFLIHQIARRGGFSQPNDNRRACLVVLLFIGAMVAIGSILTVLLSAGPHLASLALYGLVTQLILVAIARYAFAT